MIYNVNGVEVYDGYQINGTISESLYDYQGNLLEESDYDYYANEYQHTILLARDEWTAEYRADRTVVPMVLTTDQHNTLSTTFAIELFRYLAKAVKWNECSTLLNLGDVVGDTYDAASLAAMNFAQYPIPKEKRIDVIGNHDTWGDWISDAALNAPTEQFWSELLPYFDNSEHDGYVAGGTHQTSEYVVDDARKIKYVVLGGWDYNKQLGGHSHYVINSQNLEEIIDILSAVDEYDIVILSHIQLFYTTDTWWDPFNDEPSPDGHEPIVASGDTTLNALFDARKNKTSGTVNDNYGNPHSFDFSNCTSDLVCSLHGHAHVDAVGWHGTNHDIPVMIFDSLHYDDKPFYFINVNRTQEHVTVWRVDTTPRKTKWTIPFNKPL